MTNKRTGETYSPRKPIVREVDGAQWAGDLEGMPVRKRGGMVLRFPGMSEDEVRQLEQDIRRRSIVAHTEILRRHLVRNRPIQAIEHAQLTGYTPPRYDEVYEEFVRDLGRPECVQPIRKRSRLERFLRRIKYCKSLIVGEKSPY